MSTVQYKVFSSNEEFTEWQKGNYNDIIISVQPIVLGADVDLDGEDTKCKGNFSVNVAVFVTYRTADSEVAVGE